MNLNSMRRYIDETDHVEVRTERAEEAQRIAVAEQVGADERLQRLEADKELNPMDSLKEMQRLHGPLFLLAIVLFAADIPIQYALNSVAFPNLWWVALVVIAVLVAAGIGAVVEVGAFALLFDPSSPRRTVRLCLTYAGIIGLLAAAAGTVLLFSRTASGAVIDFLVQAVPISLWVLGESLPVAAGLLSAAVWTLGYPDRRDSKIEKYNSRLSELGRFLDWLGRDKQRRAGRVVALLVAVCFLAAPAFSLGSSTPPAPTSTEKAAAVVNPLPARRTNSPSAVKVSVFLRNRCLVFVDMTESVDPEFRRNAIARFTRTVSEFVTVFHCSTLGIGTFADEGPFSPVTELQVVLPPSNNDCSSATFSPNGMQRITQNISGFQAFYKKRAAEACRTEVRAQLAVLREGVQELARQVGTVLNPDLPTRGRCTAINGLLSWAVSRGSTVLTITDLNETCERSPQTMELPAHSRLFFILLPSRSSMRDAVNSALNLASEWERRIQGSLVLMPSDINPGVWAELASQQR